MPARCWPPPSFTSAPIRLPRRRIIWQRQESRCGWTGRFKPSLLPSPLPSPLRPWPPKNGADLLRIACLHTAESNIAVFEESARRIDHADVMLTHDVRADLLAQVEWDQGLTLPVE